VGTRFEKLWLRLEKKGPAEAASHANRIATSVGARRARQNALLLAGVLPTEADLARSARAPVSTAGELVRGNGWDRASPPG